MFGRIFEEIYEKLKTKTWGVAIIVVALGFYIVYLVWNSFPDKVKEHLLMAPKEQNTGHPTTPLANTDPDLLQVGPSLINKEVPLVPNVQRSDPQDNAGAFKDCPICPEMVHLPGSKLAISAHETTFVLYDTFAQQTGRPLPDDKAFGRANHPVINVSWNDAVAYAEWLSAITGRRYRLPTEDEWEYAARAGSSQENPWNSNDEICVNANIYDKSLDLGDRYNWRHNCSDGYPHTAPVGSFKSNDFGVSDLFGNVWEWTSSCWNQTGTLPCKEHIIRGGSWKSSKRTRANDSYELSFSSRQSLPLNVAHEDVGFRVVTTTILKPQPPSTN